MRNKCKARDRYKVNIPEGVSGDWSITIRTAPKESEEHRKMMGLFNSMGRYVPAGKYTTLMHGGNIVMSDTPDEIRDHMYPIRMAEMSGGNCLVNGLGIGMVAAAMLNCKRVDSVTVIEKSEDVIKLVAPTLCVRFGSRFQLYRADAFKYKPKKNQHYSVVWHDIWNTICDDNLSEMHTLHRKYGRRCEWQGSWSRKLCEHMRDDHKRSSWL